VEADSELRYKMLAWRDNQLRRIRTTSNLCHLFLFATGLLKDFHLSYFSLKSLEGNTVGTLKKTMKKKR